MADNTPMLVIGIIVVVLITAGLTYYIAKSGGPGPLGNYTNQSGKPTITVSGEATKSVMPDQLTLGITVTGNGTTVADSQSGYFAVRHFLRPWHRSRARSFARLGIAGCSNGRAVAGPPGHSHANRGC